MKSNSTASSPLVPAKVQALLTRVQREIDEGLLPSCQIALGYDGEIVLSECYGDTTPDTRYCVFSATKPMVAAAMWHLLAEGEIAESDTAASYVAEFGANGKDVVTIEQLLLHTSGFPYAPLGPGKWDTSAQRREAFGRWRLNWEPGNGYEYHPTSAHWVMAEIINEVTGSDYRDVVQQRVTAPLGLAPKHDGRVLGIGPADAGDIADLVLVGEPATPEELEATFGVSELPQTEVNDEVVLSFNRPDVREVGVPGGGGFATAEDLAMLYQGFMGNPGDLFDPATLADATSNVRNRFPDPMGVPANRSLGLWLAGDDGYSHMRGLGRTVSAGAFGHNGAGGQLAWGDPASGLSLGYVTNGYDRHEVRQPKRDTAIASLAGVAASAE